MNKIEVSIPCNHHVQRSRARRSYIVSIIDYLLHFQEPLTIPLQIIFFALILELRSNYSLIVYPHLPLFSILRMCYSPLRGILPIDPKLVLRAFAVINTISIAYIFRMAAYE